MERYVALLVVAWALAATSCKTACDEETPCPADSRCGLDGFCALITTEGEEGEGEGEEGEGEEGEEGEGEEGEGEEGEGEEGEGEEGEGEGEGEGEQFENCAIEGDEDGDGFADCDDSDCLPGMCGQCQTELTFARVGEPLPFAATAVAFDGMDATYFIEGESIRRRRAELVEQIYCGIPLVQLDAGIDSLGSAAVAKEFDGQACLWTGGGGVLIELDPAVADVAVAPLGTITIQVEGTGFRLNWDNNSANRPTATYSSALADVASLRFVRNGDGDHRLYVLLRSASGAGELLRIGFVFAAISTITLDPPLPVPEGPFAIYGDDIVQLNAFESSTSVWLQGNGRSGAVLGEASLAVQVDPTCQVEPQVVLHRDDKLIDVVKVNDIVIAATATELLRWSGALTDAPERFPVPFAVVRLHVAGNRLLVVGTDSDGAALFRTEDMVEVWRDNLFRVAGVVNAVGGVGIVDTEAGIRVIGEGDVLGGRSLFPVRPGSDSIFVNAVGQSTTQTQFAVTIDPFVGAPIAAVVRCAALSLCSTSAVLPNDRVAGFFVSPAGTAVVAQTDANGDSFLRVVVPTATTANTLAVADDAFRFGARFEPDLDGTNLVVATHLGPFRVVSFASASEGLAMVGPIAIDNALTARFILPVSDGNCADAFSDFGVAGTICVNGGLTVSTALDVPSGALLAGPPGIDSVTLYETRGGKTRQWLAR